MRKYETVIVIDSLLKSEEIENIISKYEQFISDNGGKIDTIDRWGKKRLAYEIKKRQYGYFVLIRFDAPPMLIKQLTREYRLNEALLRYMTLKLSKNALKVLEAHQAPAAKTQAAPAPTQEVVEPEKEDDARASLDSGNPEPIEGQEGEVKAETAENVSETTAERASETVDEGEKIEVLDQEVTPEPEKSNEEE